MEILFSTDRFNVIKVDDKVGIAPLYLSVAILPFVQDNRGLPKQLGVLVEKNPMRSGKNMTVITGKDEGEDPDVLSTAQRRLLDISGLDVQDPDRWHFLGFMTTHKWVSQEIPCFAVDITGLSYNAPEEEENKDGVKDEKDKVFSIVSVNQALDSDDCFIPAMFMKIFKYIFGFASEQAEEEQIAKGGDKLEQEILAIDGIVGAGNSGKEWIIHVKAGSDKEGIKSRVQEIVGDVSIKIEETKEDKSE